MAHVWVPVWEFKKTTLGEEPNTQIQWESLGFIVINKAHVIFCKKLHCFSRFWYSHPSWMLHRWEKGEDQNWDYTIRREAMATVPISVPQQLALGLVQPAEIAPETHGRYQRMVPFRKCESSQSTNHFHFFIIQRYINEYRNKSTNTG